MVHNELLHVNLPPVVSFSDSKILELDLVFFFLFFCKIFAGTLKSL